MFWQPKSNEWQRQNTALEDILMHIAAPMFVTDKDLRIVRINDAALQATGYSREEVVGKMTCASLSKTPLCGTENCTIRTCMRTRQPLTGETFLTRRDGQKVPIAAACSALFDAAGNPAGGIEVIVDRTQAATLQAETLHQRETLEAGVKVVCRVMEAAAAKDLTQRVDAELVGDLDTLKQGVNQCFDALEGALGQVALGTEQVAAASGQINSGSQSLARSASEQAAALEEISSSLQELASMTKQTALSSREGLGLSGEARALAGSGVDSMHQLTAAIGEIMSSADATAKIVKVIDEIAFQTNLLALNAAVEAARAGDAGRGFAVVADEVRSLAIRSAEAAKRTAALIETSVKSAQHGVELNQQVLKGLEEINTQVGKVNTVMTDIAAASDQQSQGLDQITKGIEQLNQATQQVAASAEESASAAEELDSQAAEMRGSVEAFKVSGAEAPSSAAVTDRTPEFAVLRARTQVPVRKGTTRTPRLNGVYAGVGS